LIDGYSEAPKEKQWCVYLLQCSDPKQSLYCGITNDLEKRIATHNKNKGAKFTRGKTPVKLLKSWDCDSKSQALKEEYRIKQLTRKEKLALI
jgi:putative endonuclease